LWAFATEHLLGEGIHPEHLNDDRLGRVLDALHEAGLTELFVTIALAAAKIEGVNTNTSHLDSTSFHVHGLYNREQTLVNGEPIPINITYGYSRDHRPDLKQFIVDLICSGDGGIPLYLRMADGNESDQAIFASLMNEFRENWEMDSLFVADAALYSEENLQQIKHLRWLSRVPATLSQAKQLISELPDVVLRDSTLPGYKIASCCSNYGGIRQRWLVVESEKRKESDLKKLRQKIEKKQQEAFREIKELSQENFACQPDAEQAAIALNKKLRYFMLTDIEIVKIPYYTQAGRPKKGAKPDGYHCQIRADLELKEDVVEIEKNQAGRFILATNVLLEEELSDDEMLREYKNQQSTERGFRFLKDPLFFTGSVFLKNNKRVAALAMVMGLCLLVYSLGQRELRSALAKAKKSIKNQVGKPTATPTLRWVFQCFQSIHLLTVNGVQKITHLTQERQWILQFLGASCRKYYLLL
jgi:transposase